MRLLGPAPRVAIAATVLAVIAAGSAPAQSQYYNLDGGRPGRVEDAEATARYSLAIDLGPLQFERLAGGTHRYRAEPKLSYGVLPFTEIELRVPVVRLDPSRGSGLLSQTGVASLAIGALHAFNLETADIPALALAGEVALPVGTLAAPAAAFTLKALVTRTSRLARFHLNLGAGTYSVRTGPASDTVCTQPSRPGFTLPGQTTCSGQVPLIFDTPCSVAPHEATTAIRSSTTCLGSARTEIMAAAPATRSSGSRWLAGIGADHAFALQSTLVTADVVAEHFIGLYAPVDWTAEVGLRHQVTPTLLIHAGAGRHFAGVVRSTSITIGATYEFATRAWLGAHPRSS